MIRTDCRGSRPLRFAPLSTLADARFTRLWRQAATYATEVAAAAHDWSAADRLLSLIAPDNLRSQRVAERLGMRPTETVELPDGGLRLVWLHPR